MRTLVLPDGSLVKPVDIRTAQVSPHFWNSSKYYVDLHMRNGGAREDVQHVSRDCAEKRQREIVDQIQQAWEEIGPYECGFEEGNARGRSEGYAEGRAEGYNAGLENGYSQGLDNGFQQGRQSIISYLFERRENLIQEQSNDNQLTPSRRRYLRNTIEILSDIIQTLHPPSNEAIDAAEI